MKGRFEFQSAKVSNFLVIKKLMGKLFESC